MVSIRGYSGYVPFYRIERESIAEQHGDYPPSGETAVPAHDEDVVTMATTAAKEALANVVEPGAIDAVYTASTSDPFNVRAIAPHVAVALGTDASVQVGDFQGSPRAATNAVQAARDSIAAGAAETALVVATDIRYADAGTDAEQIAGAGAGALVLGDGGDVAAVTDGAFETTTFVGRFEPSGETPVEGDARFNRRHGYAETVRALLQNVDVASDGPVTAVLPASNPKWPDRALDGIPFEYERTSTFDDVGYAGAASVLLDLALALDEAEPGDVVVLASYGPGGGDAFVLEVGDGADRGPETTVTEYVESKEYVTYAKHRRYRSWNER